MIDLENDFSRSLSPISHMQALDAFLSYLRIIRQVPSSFDEVDAVQRTVIYLVRPRFMRRSGFGVKCGEPSETDMSVTISCFWVYPTYGGSLLVWK